MSTIFLIMSKINIISHEYLVKFNFYTRIQKKKKMYNEPVNCKESIYAV